MKRDLSELQASFVKTEGGVDFELGQTSPTTHMAVNVTVVHRRHVAPKAADDEPPSQTVVSIPNASPAVAAVEAPLTQSLDGSVTGDSIGHQANVLEGIGEGCGAREGNRAEVTSEPPPGAGSAGRVADGGAEGGGEGSGSGGGDDEAVDSDGVSRILHYVKTKLLTSKRWPGKASMANDWLQMVPWYYLHTGRRVNVEKVQCTSKHGSNLDGTATSFFAYIFSPYGEHSVRVCLWGCFDYPKAF